MSVSKKPDALKKRTRERLEEELESGTHVDQRRDDIMRKMLASPPKQHSEMKVGGRKRKA